MNVRPKEKLCHNAGGIQAVITSAQMGQAAAVVTAQYNLRLRSQC